jgi:protein tyrosine/serine phosphatase
MTRAYRSTLQQGVKAYTQIIRHILSRPPPENAFIVHDTAGKDRTGVLCALLLSLCGVGDDIVAEEYALTEAGLGAWTEHLVTAVVNQTGAPEEAARRMVGARKESMVGALKMLKEEFGGAKGYFRTQCGLEDEEVEKIKEYLVVNEKPVCGIPGSTSGVRMN